MTVPNYAMAKLLRLASNKSRKMIRSTKSNWENAFSETNTSYVLEYFEFGSSKIKTVSINKENYLEE